jgi:hypothetical protein
MTEYEMASLFTEMRLALDGQVQVFFTMLVAFLVASYLVAHKLTRSMAAVVVGLFLVTALGGSAGIYRQAQAMGGLAREMKAAASSGKGLAWHPVAEIQEWALQIGSVGGLFIFLVATAAAVYFFFHCRRVNRIADLGEATRT